ncbi:MAG TPA: PQQ-dependent sugar dehydrogenase [Thermoanaerobaculia bacterium]
MRIDGRVAPSLLVAATAVGLALAPSPAAAQGLALVPVEVASGLVLPVGVAHAGDGSGRLFVVQQTGQIVIWDGAQVVAEPFLDLSGKVICCGERGLLGLAFHPQYSTNGQFFVNYTRTVETQLQTVIARYTVSADPDVADPDSEEILLTYDQPFANHNGGQLAFGPDGFLYVSSGDGGSGGDPQENAQALDTPLGKVLRIDVDGTDPGLAYAIPPSNPFAGAAGARGEIWAYGLRNPWRLSFDRGTGDLWIADVGQASWEEISRQPAASAGGENYGWDCREGLHDFDDGVNNADCPGKVLVDPVLEYSSASDGGGRCSVTGGYRYRGDAEPRLRGVYLFADFCTGEIFGTVPRCDGGWQANVLFDAPFNVTAFGEDEAGEVYVTEYRGGNPPPATSKLHLLALAPGSGGPDLAAAPDPLDFGTVEVGDTVTGVVTLTNAGPGPEALALEPPALSDTTRFALDLAAGASPCRSPRRCLPPGASCTLGVALRADAPAGIAESLTLDGNFNTEVVALAAEVVPCSTTTDLTLSDRTVSGVESHHACDTLTAAPNVAVAATGDLTLCGGTRVILGDGFRVEAGGRLAVSTSC